MNKNIITIDTIDMLNKLINDIKNSEHFCDKFKFSNYDYKYIMLKELKINIKSFDEKYYYHSKKSKIHISESEDGSFLISTYGMIIYNKRFNSEKEKIIYAFESQTEVLEILLEKVDQLLKKRNIYDIDGYNYNYLMKLSTGLTNNYLFFLELFVKSYLAINDEKYPPTHNLKELLKKMESVIIKKNHKNTYFNAEIVHQFSEVVKSDKLAVFGRAKKIPVLKAHHGNLYNRVDQQCEHHQDQRPSEDISVFISSESYVFSVFHEMIPFMI